MSRKAGTLQCRRGFPGQADGADFCGWQLVSVRWLKFGGDQDAPELGGHVGGRWLGLGGVPGGAGPVLAGVGGVVAGGGVPGDREGLVGQGERDGGADSAGGAVAGLPGAEELLRPRSRPQDGSGQALLRYDNGRWELLTSEEEVDRSTNRGSHGYLQATDLDEAVPLQIRTRRRYCDPRFGRMSLLRQDRGWWLFVCST